MRRAAGALAALLVGLVAIEAFSCAGLSLARGAWSTPRGRAEERAGVVRASYDAAVAESIRGERGAGDARRDAPGRGAVPAGDAQVLHPYLGFVHDPDERTQHGARPGRGGLFLGPPPPPDAFVVGVFGGSLAFYLAQYGAPFLEEALRGAAALDERAVAVRNAAYLGYKQPQQLATLAWLVTLGERFDVVVNLDGFNEIALPAAENRRQGVNPRWPRGWAWRVGAVRHPAALRAVGELAYLEARRARRVGALAASPFGWSATAHVLWRALDRGDAARVAALRERTLAAPADRGFLAAGAAFDLDDDDAVEAASVDTWLRASLAMDAFSRGMGARYLHFLQPNQYVEGTKPMGPAERAAAVRDGHPYQAPVQRGYRALVAAGAELRRAGVDFHDLTRVFEDVEEPLYVDTCCHVNAAGNRILARAIGAAIASALSAGAAAAPAAEPVSLP